MFPDFVAKPFFNSLCKPYKQGWGVIVDELLHNYDELKGREYHFKGPVVLIWGQNDKLIPVTIGEKLALHFKNATLYVIPNCGHLPSIESPIECAEIIRKDILE